MIACDCDSLFNFNSLSLRQQHMLDEHDVDTHETGRRSVFIKQSALESWRHRMNTCARPGRLSLYQLLQLLDKGQFVQMQARGCFRKATSAVSDDDSRL